MNSSGYQNPIIFNLDKDAYELDVPAPLRVYTKGGVYEVIPSGIIEEKTNLYHCITSAEDYDYVLEQFVKNQMHVFYSSLKVLVLYFDQELALHATMPLRVNVDRLQEKVSRHGVTYEVNRRVQAYHDWLMGK
ncbi:hypothetical protein [Pontibacter actiniarum]|uniref:Uncharacterized protein n=1 Tax=Pontibacter actiniarum TaxID=323450 RepID=A0A1X9YSM6_9BACT|nr:hypothetical protein [Pontibacter actiniarum]ARS35824.1 hypothetical protein CA264_10420 [Pontibacter actiniarum]